MIMIEDISKSEIEEIFSILREHFRADFSDYKLSCLERRIKRRMLLSRSADIRNYIDFLKKNENERRDLFDTVTINVTKFFRDENTFDYIFNKIIPAIRHVPDIKVWSAACASGEEAYSVSMMLDYYKEANKCRYNFTVYGTDIDRRSIQTAQEGAYTPKSLFNTPAFFRQIFELYTEKGKNIYRIMDKMQRVTRFKVENLHDANWDFKFDIILCRNVFIYFDRALQNKMLDMLARFIKPDGFLVLGRVETIFTDGKTKFEIVSNRDKIYKLKKE